MPDPILARSLALTVLSLVWFVPRVTAEMTHRYSFTADASDPIGNADGTLEGNALVDFGSVLLDGTAGTYVNLPGGLLQGYTSTTIETWAFTDANAPWVRLFDFGGVNASGQGLNYLFVSTHSGLEDVRVVISDADPGFNNEEAATRPGNLDSAVYFHVVAVVDPPNGWLALYIDGQLVSSNPNLTIPLSAISPDLCYLGRSLYTADPYYIGGFDEFRIHDSALSSGEIAAAFLAGADTLDYDPGTLTGLGLTVTPQIRVDAVARPTLIGTYSLVGTIPIGLAEVTLTSLDPAVVEVLPSGELRGRGPGSTTITAAVGAISAQASVTVVSVPAELRHRYNMNEPDGSATVTDSEGGQNGTLYPAAVGGNTILLGAGRAVFPGGAGYQNGAYIDLPDYLINSKMNITFETWFTWRGPNNTVWTRIFDFGTSSKGNDPHASGNGTSSFWLSPRSGGGVVRFDAWNGSAGVVLEGPTALPTDQESHIVCIYAPDNGISQLWVNGVLVDSDNAPFALNTMQDVNNWLGVSQWNDAPLNGEINELRIWEGALSELQIALHREAGANTIPADPGLLQSVALDLATYTLLNGNPQPTPATLSATFENMAGVDVTGLSSTKFTSSDPAVFTVGAGGQLRPAGVGSAELVAEYGGLSITSVVEVLNPTGLTIDLNSPLSAGGPFINVVMTATYDGVADTDVRAFTGAAYQSSNPSVATIAANGAVLPLRVGSTMITGSFAGFSDMVTIQVTLPAAYELATPIHRYSFSEVPGSTTVQDTIGNAHGTLRNPSATSDFNGAGRLLLAGGAWDAVPEPAYVNLPNGLVSGLPSATFEAWVRWSGPAGSSWQRIFDFGRNSAVDGGGNFVEDTYGNPGLSYLYLSPRSGANTLRFAIRQGTGPETPLLDVAPMPVNTDTHVALVYDTAAGAARLYVNGQRVATGAITLPLMIVEDRNVYLGRSQWTDPLFAGQFDEFRIYRGTFLDDEVEVSFATGPNQLPDISPAPPLTATLSANNIELMWPVSATGFGLETTTALGTAASWGPVPDDPVVEDGMNKVSLPVTGEAGYYRLKK